MLANRRARALTSKLPSEKTVSRREETRARFTAEFDDGARVGFFGRTEGPRESGGYPQGFQTWPPERRDAWFCGWNAGFSASKNLRDDR